MWYYVVFISCCLFEGTPRAATSGAQTACREPRAMSPGAQSGTPRLLGAATPGAPMAAKLYAPKVVAAIDIT